RAGAAEPDHAVLAVAHPANGPAGNPPPSSSGSLAVTPTDLVVPPEQGGQRLDRFLTSFLGSHSRSQLQKLIADGLVTVAGRTAKANLTLKDGDRVRIELPEPAPSDVASEDLPLEVL